MKTGLMKNRGDLTHGEQAAQAMMTICIKTEEIQITIPILTENILLLVSHKGKRKHLIFICCEFGLICESLQNIIK